MSEQIVTPDTAALTVPNKDAKINLLDLNRQQMREFFKNMGEKPFRADQVMKWMYHYCWVFLRWSTCSRAVKLKNIQTD